MEQRTSSRRRGTLVPRGRRHAPRRGVAALVMVLLLLLINLIIIGAALSGARDQDVSVRRIETVRAFYAAEAGANMAVRELYVGSDEDGDGIVGSVSDDGDDSNDPTIGAARFNVKQGSAPVVVRSGGRSGTARRTIDITVE